MQGRSSVLGLAAACSLLIVPTATAIANVTAVTVVIDSLTTQPVGTGLIPPSEDVDYVFLTEGALRDFTAIHPFVDEWFSSEGLTRQSRAGQPVPGVYGSAIFTFGAGFGGQDYLRNRGTYPTYPSDVGHELKVGVNMSDADLSSIRGTAVIHIIELGDDYASSTEITINSSSVMPIATGLIADEGDNFIVLCHGAMEFFLSVHPFTNWFGPAGFHDLNRAGEQNPDLPYGAVIGTFNPSLLSAFYIGPGGSWRTQIADEGDELKLGVNMSAADLASTSGAMIVTVIEVPDKVVAAPEAGGAAHPVIHLNPSFPNPMNPGTTIRYAVPEDGRVLLRVYDVSGRFIRTLVDEQLPVGEHEVRWDGRDDHGREVVAGQYFYQLSTPSGSETRRLTVVR